MEFAKGLKFILIFLLLMAFYSCELINPPEEIPSYIHLKTFQLATKNGEGSNSQKITDAWVYVGGQLMGAFPLPATVPVLASGVQELIIDPGVKDNGIEATPEIYPYYQRFTSQLNLEPGRIDTIQPATKYKENLTFAMLEEFESDFHLLRDDMDGNEATIVAFDKTDIFEGAGSGRIVLTKENPDIIVATSIKFVDLPTNGISAVYLEMDYKTDLNLEIGLRGFDSSGQGFTNFSHGLNPKSSWNKVYINLTTPLAASQFDTYKLVFKASFPTNDPEFTKSQAIVLLDNIKLLHRKE